MRGSVSSDLSFVNPPIIETVVHVLVYSTLARAGKAALSRNLRNLRLQLLP